MSKCSWSEEYKNNGVIGILFMGWMKLTYFVADSDLLKPTHRKEKLVTLAFMVLTSLGAYWFSQGQFGILTYPTAVYLLGSRWWKPVPFRAYEYIPYFIILIIDATSTLSTIYKG